MKNTLLLFLLFFSFSIFSQTKEIIDGKEYIVHEVVKGNTLYSISKQYNISLSDILNNNPEAEKGINIGQKLYFPTKTVVTSSTNTILDGKAFDDSVKLKRFHIVGKQETLYAITRMYNTTLNDIIKMNPGIESGIQVGQKLIIPDEENKTSTSTSTNIIYYDTVIPHQVSKSETLFSISKRYIVPQKDIIAYNGIKNNTITPGTIIYIPLKKEEYKPIEIRDIAKIKVEEKEKEVPVKSDFVFKQKDSYKVIIALPLGLSNKDEKFGDISTEFYMGAAYALDSLQKSGLTADVYVIDCSGDTTAFKKKLENHLDADIVIGPFVGSSMDVAANFCKKNKIKIINPLLGYTKPLRGNEYVVNAMTSDLSLMEGMAIYLSGKTDAGKIILVKPTANDMPLYNAFRNKLQTLNGNTGVKFIECELSDLPGYFAKGINTTIVYPSRESNAVTKFMNIVHQNNTKVGSGTISIFGTKEWTTMDRVKNYYKNTYNFHFSMANDLDYTKSETKKVANGFRQKYNTDFTKIMAQGFDVTYYFISLLFMSKKPSDLIMNDFNVKRVSNVDGFENVSTYIYKQSDFDYILLDKIK